LLAPQAFFETPRRKDAKFFSNPSWRLGVLAFQPFIAMPAAQASSECRILIWNDYKIHMTH
jgi:hypothetical protein